MGEAAEDLKVVYLKDQYEFNDLKSTMLKYLNKQEKELKRLNSKKYRLKMELTGRAGVIG